MGSGDLRATCHHKPQTPTAVIIPLPLGCVWGMESVRMRRGVGGLESVRPPHDYCDIRKTNQYTQKTVAYTHQTPQTLYSV